METSRRRLLLAPLAARVALARAQPRFPERTIVLVVPFAAGGIADLAARTVAEPMAKSLGQAVVVENRPGAGSIVAAQAVASARPDGHTLLLVSNANAVSVGLFRRLPYDPLRDFAPIGTLGVFDLGIFVPSRSRFGSLGDVVAFARANPGRLNVGTIAVGSTQHLAARLFETVAGVQTLAVPYKGSPALLTALLAGEVDVAFEVLGPMLPQVAAGSVKALAVTSGQRNPVLPEVPTVQQAGIAGYDVASWNGLAAPAGTPAAICERLNLALRDAVAVPAVGARLALAGMRVGTGSPAELQALMASEIRRWGDVIKAARIEPE